MTLIHIGARAVGDDQPCFIIAEAGVNHNGSLELAKRLVDIASDAGADAVKFQKRTVNDILIAEALNRPYTVPTALGPSGARTGGSRSPWLIPARSSGRERRKGGRRAGSRR